jgi:predicted NBD/HSP70 family sugar kinase
MSLQQQRHGGNDYLSSYREQNLTTVLQLLKENPPLSRAQLAQLTGLNKTTISSLVQELASLDLVHYTGLDTSGGGRPGNLIEINGQSRSAVGVELNDGYVQAVLIDLTGETLWRGTALMPPFPDPDYAIQEILNLVELAVAISTSLGDAPIGIGIGVSGLIDIAQGRIISAPTLGWRDISLAPVIEASTGLPVFVDKSANAAAVGEEFFGVARQSAHFVYVLLSNTLSSGLFLNGNIYRGFAGSAGEFEQATTELSLSPGAALAASGEPRTLDSLVRAYAAGESEIVRLIDNYAQKAAQPITELNTLLNPELIVIGGRFSVLGAHLLSIITHVVVESSDLSGVRVELSALGAYGVPTGAATLAVKSFLSNLRRAK